MTGHHNGLISALRAEVLVPDDTFSEGYMSYMESGGGFLSNEKWKRVYFVLRGCELYFFKTKEDFDLRPKQSSLKNRPIQINGCGRIELTLHEFNYSYRYEVSISSDDSSHLQINLSVRIFS
jgi:hypothetical protein